MEEPSPSDSQQKPKLKVEFDSGDEIIEGLQIAMARHKISSGQIVSCGGHVAEATIRTFDGEQKKVKDCLIAGTTTHLMKNGHGYKVDLPVVVSAGEDITNGILKNAVAGKFFVIEVEIA